MKTRRKVSRNGTRGRNGGLGFGEDALGDLDARCTQRRYAGRPAAFMVRLSASTSRIGRVSAAKAVARTGNRSPHCRAGPRSTWMTPSGDIFVYSASPS
jgi:hypothetical protein